MLNFNINVNDGVSPDLRAKLEGLQNTAPLMQKLGETLAKSVRAHFMVRDKEGNAKGWPSRHFWTREGRANTALTYHNANEAVVTIASPAIYHKLMGGEVVPKRGRALAIPASAAAYAAGQPSAMNKDMLEFVPLNSGGLVGMLVERQHDVLRRTKKGFRQGGLASRKGGAIWYWLMAKVTHKPDPRTLPEDAEAEAQVYFAANNYLAGIMSKTG